MAKFVLTAQLQLQAPKNTQQVLQQMRQQLQGVTVPVAVQASSQAIKQINQVSASTKQAASAADVMGRSFGIAIKRFAAFTIASRAVSLFTNSLANAIEESIAFQDEIVRLSQVTGKTVKQLEGLRNTVDALSTNLGVSSKDILSTATILAQAGIQAKDLDIALTALAKTALAPTFDNITETAEGAVAILAQFEEGVGALERQFGAINTVSAQFAVESDDLVDAVRRFGGVFKSSGGSLEELLALFTSVRATTRESAESISTGLRTIFTRIQRPATIEYLKQFGVELVDLEGKFVGPYEAVRQLSQALGGLQEGDITFIRVAEELGGFRQIGKVIPLLQQFEVAERARQVALEGGTSLTKDAETAQQSLARQIIKVKEEFLALVRSIAESTSFQLFARTSLEVASNLIKIADTIKPLIPLITALAAIKFAQGFGSFISSAGAAVRGIGSVGGAKNSSVQGFATGGLVPGTGNRDTVPAMLTPGEFVIRKSSVKKLGAAKLAAMNDNRYAAGGTVSPDRGAYGEKEPGPNELIKGLNLKFGSPRAELLKQRSPEGEKARQKARQELAEKKLQEEDITLIKERNKLVQKYPGGAFTTKKGVIGGFFLNPEKGLEDGPTRLSKDLPFELDGKDAVLAKGSTIISYLPYRKDMKKNKIISDIVDATTQKGVQDSIVLASNAIGSLPISDFGTISLNQNQIEEAAMKVSEDKQVFSTLGGYVYEGIIQGLTGAKLEGGQASFDFPNINDQNKELLAAFFGSNVSDFEMLEKADAKRTFNSNMIESIFDKVILDIQGKKSPKDMRGIEELSVSKMATGGPVGTDTVPALLTPGEFVIKKSSAQKIGYANLNRMNKTGTDNVERYATGGVVGSIQRFANGGSPQPVAPSDPEIPQNLIEFFDLLNKSLSKPLDFSKKSTIDILKSESERYKSQKSGPGLELGKSIEDFNKEIVQFQKELSLFEKENTLLKKTMRLLNNVVDSTTKSFKNLSNISFKKKTLTPTADNFYISDKINEAFSGFKDFSLGGVKSLIDEESAPRPQYGKKEQLEESNKIDEEIKKRRDRISKNTPNAELVSKLENQITELKTNKFLLGINTQSVQSLIDEELKPKGPSSSPSASKPSGAKRQAAEEGINKTLTKLIAMQAGIALVNQALGKLRPEITNTSTSFQKITASFVDSFQTISVVTGSAVSALDYFGISLNSKGIAQFAGNIKRAGAGLRSLGASLGTGTTALGTFGKTLGPVATSAGNGLFSLGASATAAAGPLAVVVAAIAAFYAALYLGVKALDAYRDAQGKNKRAIEDGNVELAKSTSIIAANNDLTNKLVLTLALFNPIGVILLKLAEETELVQSGLNKFRDNLLTPLGLSASTETIQAQAGLDAQRIKSERELAVNAKRAAMALADVESGSMAFSEVFQSGALTADLQNNLDEFSMSMDLVSKQRKDADKTAALEKATSISTTELLTGGYAAKLATRSLMSMFGTSSQEQRAVADKAAFENMNQFIKNIEKTLPDANRQLKIQAASGKQGLFNFEGLTTNEEKIKQITSNLGTQGVGIQRNFDKLAEEINKLEAIGINERSKEQSRLLDQAKVEQESFIKATQNANKEGVRTANIAKLLNIGLFGMSDKISSVNAKLDNFPEIGQVASSFEESMNNITIALGSGANAIRESDIDKSISTLESKLQQFGLPANGLQDLKKRIYGISNVFKTVQSPAFIKELQDDIAKYGQVNASNLQKKISTILSKSGIDDAARNGIVEAISKIDPDSISSISSELNQGNIGPLLKSLEEISGPVMEQLKSVVNGAIEAEQKLMNLTKARIQIESEYVSAQRQAIDLQMEAANIMSEFGGLKVSNFQKTAANIASFNVGARFAGVSGLQTGSVQDIQNIATQIFSNFAKLQNKETGAVIAGSKGAGFTGAGGVEQDKRQQLKQLQQDLINTTKQEIQIRKDELEIIRKKNETERSALEKLISGDVEGFLQQQSAAGAAAALRVGDTSLTKLFSSGALGAGFQTLEGQGLSDAQMAQAANAALSSIGITDRRSAEVLARTTPEEEELKFNIKNLAQTLSGLGQNFANMELMRVQTAQMAIDASNAKINITGSQFGAPPVQAKARGGMVYASRGMFIPRGTDTVPAMLTPGEFVVNRSAVKRGNNLQILKTMNNGGGASAPGAKSGGGSVRYYQAGGVVDAIGNAFNNALPDLRNVFSNFTAAVDKLVNSQFSVKLDTTNVNVNFNGASFLATLREDIRNEILKDVAREIQSYRTNNSGDLVKRNVL